MPENPTLPIPPTPPEGAVPPTAPPPMESIMDESLRRAVHEMWESRQQPIFQSIFNTNAINPDGSENSLSDLDLDPSPTDEQRIVRRSTPRPPTPRPAHEWQSIMPVGPDTICEVIFHCNDCGHNMLLEYRYGILYRQEWDVTCHTCDSNHDISIRRVLINSTRQDITSLTPNNRSVCDRCSIGERPGHRLREYRMQDGNTQVVCRECQLILQREELIHGHNWVPGNYRLFHGSQEKLTPRTLLYGTELEINTPGDRVNHAEEFRKWLGQNGMDSYFFFKHDGSISNGYEIVTHPMTSRARQERVDWREVCKYLLATGARSEESGECGLHVHASSAALNHRDIAKLKYFFFANRMMLHRFSRRQGYRYCIVEEFGLRRNKAFGNGAINAILSRFPDSGDRYVAVNTHTGKPTVEFRIMRGTLDHRRLISYFQFFDAVIHFVKEHSLMSQDTPYAWSKFYEYAGASSRYGHLERYLTKEGLK